MEPFEMPNDASRIFGTGLHGNDATDKQQEDSSPALEFQDVNGASPVFLPVNPVPSPNGSELHVEPVFVPAQDPDSGVRGDSPVVINQEAESFRLLSPIAEWECSSPISDTQDKGTFVEEAEILAALFPKPKEQSQWQEEARALPYEHEIEEISFLEKIFNLSPELDDETRAKTASPTPEPAIVPPVTPPQPSSPVGMPPRSASPDANPVVLPHLEDDILNIGNVLQPLAVPGLFPQPAIDPLKVRNPRKPPKKAYRCLACCITYFSEKQYEAHLGGSRHKRTRRFKQNNLIQEENDRDDGFSVRDGRSCCKFCSVTVTGIRQLKQHLKGRSHKNQKKRIKKIKNDNNSAGFQVFEPRVNLYYCNECRTSITGEIPYVDHMHGKRHKRAVRLRRMGPRGF